MGFVAFVVPSPNFLTRDQPISRLFSCSRFGAISCYGLTAGVGSLWTFALCSPKLILMSFGIQRRKLFVVECKRCRRDVPAGVPEFPFQSIVVVCPLCGEQRRYLPSEVALGTPHHLVAKQARAGQS